MGFDGDRDVRRRVHGSIALHLAVLKSGAGLQFQREQRKERRFGTRHVGCET